MLYVVVGSASHVRTDLLAHCLLWSSCICVCTELLTVERLRFLYSQVLQGRQACLFVRARQSVIIMHHYRLGIVCPQLHPQCLGAFVLLSLGGSKLCCTEESAVAGLLCAHMWLPSAPLLQAISLWPNIILVWFSISQHFMHAIDTSTTLMWTGCEL